VNAVTLAGDVMSVPVGVSPAALAGHAAGLPPSSVVGSPPVAPELPVAVEAPEPVEAPELLEALPPLPVVDPPAPLDRELHAAPTAPSATRDTTKDATSGGRAFRTMDPRWVQGRERLAGGTNSLPPSPTSPQPSAYFGSSEPISPADPPILECAP
jgi:hypothetical protein